MGRFIMECPNCGRYVQAETGLFAKRKIDCSCGYTIQVRTDKLTSRICPHCGNAVVFDQSKGEKALCPVCKEPINTMAEQTKTEEISCEQCGVRLIVNVAAQMYVCPVCDCVNNVAERIASERIKRDGLASVIKYEGEGDTLVWKHPIEDFNYGSQLIVHESQEAIFFRDGQALDLFGAGRYTLKTQQLPMLEKIYKLPTDTEGTFHSEVYYINLVTIMGVKWGTDSKVRMFDPSTGLHVELGACGEFNIHVVNSRKLLIKLIGTTSTLRQEQILGIGDGKGYFRAMIMTQVKSYLAQVIKNCKINVLEIDEHLLDISGELKKRLNEYLNKYGLEISEFFVSRIMTPDDDPNFQRMKEQYAEQYLLVRQEQIRKKEAEAAAARKEVEATTAARVKLIGAQAQAEAYRMQAEAEAAEMRMKGYTYQQETARQIGKEAMKNGLGAGSGSLGDIAGLGIGLGAMGSVIGMTKDAIAPATDAVGQLRQAVNSTIEKSGTWNCTCGQKNIESNFCPNCGAKNTESQPENSWDCTCGTKGIMFKFCPNCGRKRPETREDWDCPNCGTKKITFNFCPNCGMKRPEKTQTWDCTCGTKDIVFNFCPNCGRKRGE